MLAKFSVAATAVLMAAGLAWGQTSGVDSGGWRSVKSGPPQVSDQSGAAAGAVSGADAGAARRGVPDTRVPAPLAAISGSPKQPIARVTGGSGILPNDHGQVWREYDISPYTLRVTTTNRPEQAIVDWILRETGYEVWHSEPLGILSADRNTLRVYHTPQTQAVVAGIVNRFVSSKAQTRAFGLRVVTVDHPNWRVRAQRMLQPVAVQTPGVQAWLIEREVAAILLAELQRRTDYREHSSRHLLVNSGQSTVVSSMWGRPYAQDVILRRDSFPGFELDMAEVDEGFSLELDPLLSVDGRTIDAVIKCNIDQVEKMVPVMLDVPTEMAPRQRAKIEIPQITQFRFQERFRWPADKVLLIGMGIVALPIPAQGKSLLGGLPLPLPGSPPRADLLVFVESKGKIGQAPRALQAARYKAKTYRGRY